MYDNITVNIHLTSQEQPETLSFETVEALHDAANERQKGFPDVALNHKVWDEAGHYFDPYFLSLLNSKTMEVKVGSDLYKATKTEMLIRRGGATTWESLYFYGEDGKQDLRESALIREKMDRLDSIEPSFFKNQDNLKLFLRVKAERMASKDGSMPSLKDYFDPDSSIVYYRDYQNGPLKSATMRFWKWNESYTKTFGGRRSKGGTVLQINRGTGYVTGSGQIGPFFPDNTADNTLPWVKVTVRGGKAGGGYYEGSAESNGWTVTKDDVGRDANQGTTSLHWGSYRLSYSKIVVQHMTASPES